MLQEGIHIVVSEERLKAIEESINRLEFIIKGLKSEEKQIGDWLPENEFLKLSQLGKTSLYNLRKSGQLSSSTISGRGVFYRKSDLERILDNNERKK